MKVLEDFWYGNINPQRESKEYNREIRGLLTPMDRESKDWVQLGLDIAKTATELAVNKPSPEVVRMQNAAKEYDLERVVVFPCVVEGLHVPVIRMYGGDIAAFCKHLGIILLAESECGASGANIQKLEALCGIEIYKRC